eukprot:1584806-Rhodomonas_salina.2
MDEGEGGQGGKWGCSGLSVFCLFTQTMKSTGFSASPRRKKKGPWGPITSPKRMERSMKRAERGRLRPENLWYHAFHVVPHFVPTSQLRNKERSLVVILSSMGSVTPLQSQHKLQTHLPFYPGANYPGSCYLRSMAEIEVELVDAAEFEAIELAVAQAQAAYAASRPKSLLAVADCCCWTRRQARYGETRLSLRHRQLKQRLLALSSRLTGAVSQS